MKNVKGFGVALLALQVVCFQAEASTMKIMVCESTKKEKDGTPYHKWQAIFDSSLFSKGKLEYQLTEWHAESQKNDGKPTSFPMQVTPTTLKFYESITVRGKTNWFSTNVDRQTLKYGTKYSPPTQAGLCTISEFKTAI